MGKIDQDKKKQELSSHQLERISWIAGQTKHALLAGIGAVQELEHSMQQEPSAEAAQKLLDEAAQQIAGQPENEQEVAEIKQRLAKLILAWDEIESQLEYLVDAQREFEGDESLWDQAEPPPLPRPN
uniref:Uncharacterized protein n=1 Tax=Magnetococcus massalia (strain MO-1) TaxID=451514 RepID=A0A1S7LCE4_MAGMO|nr:conserved protein of unknown function [Candidatus Magnetococcus massalia]